MESQRSGALLEARTLQKDALEGAPWVPPQHPPGLALIFVLVTLAS